MHKRLSVTLVLSVVMLLVFSSGAWAAGGGSFTDTQGHWASAQIEAVAARGIMRGVGNGLFAPDQVMTRVQFAVALHNAFKFDYGDRKFVKAPVVTDYYDDVRPDCWYSEAVLLCAANNIFTVNDRKFRPDEPITRMEAAQAIEKSFKAKNITVMMIMIWPNYKDLSQEETSRIIFASNTGIMKGWNGYFRPYQPLTRAEAAAALERTARIIQQNTEAGK